MSPSSAAAKIRALVDAAARTRVAKAMARAALNFTSLGFQRRTDPSNGAWAPTKQRNPILERTGNLRRSFRITELSERGFTVGTNVPYATFHQHGTSRMPARRMLPGDVLDESWSAAMRDAAVRALVGEGE